MLLRRFFYKKKKKDKKSRMRRCNIKVACERKYATLAKFIPGDKSLLAVDMWMVNRAAHGLR